MKGHVQKGKRTIILIFAVIVAIRIGYIFFRDEVDREVTVTYRYDLTEAEMIPCRALSQTFIPSDQRLNSLEFFFGDIDEASASPVRMAIYGDDLVYQTNITLKAEDNLTWKTVFVNAPLQPGKEYRIELTAGEDGGAVPAIAVSADNRSPEVTGSSADGSALEGSIAIQHAYLRAPDLLDRIIIASLWVLLFVTSSAVVLRLDRLLGKTRTLTDALAGQIGDFACTCGIELLCAFVIINNSGIPFQGLTKAFLYALSAVAALSGAEKKSFTQGLLDRPWKKVLFALLCFYAAFALVGQRILIYPLNRRIRAEGLFVLLCAVVWFVPVIRSAFFWLDAGVWKCFGGESRLKTWQFALLCVLLLLLPAAYNLVANNPGISDVDTYEAFEKNAQNLYGMYNWHPAFYSIVLHKLQRVWNSTYMVILVQYFFWSYVQLELLFFLRKKGMRDSVLLCLAFLSGFNAANLLFLNTIWKDVPYAYCVLWILVILARLCSDPAAYRKHWFIYLELFVALVFMGLLRKNGIVPFVIIAVSLLLVFRKSIKLLLAFAAAVLFMFYIQGPVYTHYQVVEPGRRGIYIGLGQDILGAYYGGGEVSEKTLQMINVMTHHNNAEFDYNPTWAHQAYDLDAEPQDFILAYIDTFLKNPVLVSRAVIDRIDCIWDVFQGEDAIVQNTNFTDTEDGDRRWNEFYPARVFRSIYPAMSEATQYTNDAQWLDAVTWRCGLLTLLGMTALTWMLVCLGRIRHILLFVPAVGQIMSLLLSTGWTDYRYFWPNNLLNLAVIPLVLLAVRQSRQAETAAAPAAGKIERKERTGI